ncbi:Isoquinoline 1-oxidoreductase subunit [Croceibacterium sp. TMG7-5b_MA50]|uniref:Isoquinoline 1-oxidoreductase subunit n=1 Tax=Croceibacterium sp. TMG7-5b_MA50 TaxID=3121290 RepID=UPI0032218DB1
MRLWRVRIGCLPLTLLVLAIILLAAIIALRSPPLPEARPLAEEASALAPEQLRTVASFAGITDPAMRSVALFQEAGRVIQHPRCMNCHPRSDSPTQTDTMRPHMPAVTRGPDDGGDPLLRCTTCHNSANFAASGVPGNPKWQLAPIEQAWQGRTLGQICRQLLDPARSHMTRAELLHHVTHDELVAWAWHPGGDRTPAPGTQAAFGALIDAWLETGAACPA